MNRRDFLRKGALAAAGAAVGGTLLSGLTGLSGCSAPGKKRIGLQLYSLREAMGNDPLGTLKQVAGIGYTELEAANYGDGTIYGYAAAEFRKIVEDLGMTLSSAHVGYGYDPANDEAVMAWWNKALDMHAEAGCRYVVVPAFDMGETLDHIKMYCDYFNRVAEMAKSKGLQFGYHNHSGEFQQRDGEIIYDYMLTNTSDNVAFEMDVYWVTKGGYSPVDYLNKYAGRFPLLHIKDESIIGYSETIDFKPIFEAAYAQGMKDYYVEVEQYQLPPINCVQKSYDFLSVAEYVK